MELDGLFLIAFQSSLVLGLVHGVNPCGHSWLVLAPFVVGQKRGRKVALLTAAFLAGTALACLLLGLTLGAVSSFIPGALQFWIEIGTSLMLVALGTILLLKPGLIHHHYEEEHGHDHAHDLELIPGHNHGGHRRAQTAARTGQTISRSKLTGLTLFGIGFANMVIPCPTVAIMYKYALDSADVWKATVIFGAYALSTALTVGGVIFAIYRVARILEKLTRDGVEHTLMRAAGVVTILFAGFSLFSQLP